MLQLWLQRVLMFIPIRKRIRIGLVALVLLFSTQLACDLLPGAEPTATSEPAAIEEATITPTQTPTRQIAPPTPTRESAKTGDQIATRPPVEPGMACLGSSGEGLTCLDDTGWHIYTKDNSPLAGDYIWSIAVCPQGHLAIATNSGISTFDGQTWKEYPAGWGHASPGTVTCDARGGFWVTHFRGVSHFDGADWTTFPADQLATGESATDLVEDVAIDTVGRVWVLTAASVAVFEDNSWTVYQEGQGFEKRFFFDSLTIDWQNRVWAAHSNGLLMFKGGEWTAYPTADFSTIESLAVDLQGRAWVGTLSNGVSVLERGGWLTYDRTNSKLGCDRVREMFTDAQDRVWIGTRWGLYVLDGSQWHIFRMENAGLADHDISALAVVAGGPNLPEPQPKPAGSMQGRIAFDDATPIVNAPVEICVESIGSRFYGETPCSDQPFMRRTETDEDGMFVFHDLPPGFYVITAYTGESWARLMTDLGLVSERVLVGPGQETDLGELVVSSE